MIPQDFPQTFIRFGHKIYFYEMLFYKLKIPNPVRKQRILHISQLKIILVNIYHFYICIAMETVIYKRFLIHLFLLVMTTTIYFFYNHNSLLMSTQTYQKHLACKGIVMYVSSGYICSSTVKIVSNL